MKHFLITRFNLKNSHWKKDGENFIALTKEWLNHRFYFFETYCLPSVLNQTNKNFTWLIAFDIDTPVIYKERILSLIKGHSNIHPLFIDGFLGLQPSIKEEIKHLVDGQNQYIITTRLDNDDIIHKDFIKTIQDSFVPTANTVIDLRRGYQLIEKNGIFEARVFNSAYNAFISLVESTSDYETVISKEHGAWKKNTIKILNAKDCLWIQLVHDRNQANKKDYSLKRITKLDFQDFGISLQPVKSNPILITFYNILLYPYRVFMSIKKSVKDYLTQ